MKCICGNIGPTMHCVHCTDYDTRIGLAKNTELIEVPEIKIDNNTSEIEDIKDKMRETMTEGLGVSPELLTYKSRSR